MVVFVRVFLNKNFTSQQFFLFCIRGVYFTRETHFTRFTQFKLYNNTQFKVCVRWSSAQCLSIYRATFSMVRDSCMFPFICSLSCYGFVYEFSDRNSNTLGLRVKFKMYPEQDYSWFFFQGDDI